MPPRLERWQQRKQLHFLTWSCHGRKPYLATSSAAAIFERSLENTRLKYQFLVLGYVVMPEHVHLLVSEPPTHPLSTVIGALKRSVSKQLAEKPFWLPRYYDANITSEAPRIDALRYMHRNPVKRGLVERPEDYLWSSFRYYAFGEGGTVTITRAEG